MLAILSHSIISGLSIRINTYYPRSDQLKDRGIYITCERECHHPKHQFSEAFSPTTLFPVRQTRVRSKKLCRFNHSCP